MRVSNLVHAGAVRAAVTVDGGRVLVRDLDPSLPDDVEGLVAGGHLPRVAELSAAVGDAVPPVAPTAAPAPVVRRPGKVMGIGLNYVAHADDLAAPRPDEPAVFLKAAHTIIGPGEPIPLPPQSARVTSEGELGLVIGRPCWNVDEAAALSHVAGAVAVLDQTAEDILQRNPRFLVRSKNFPGFLGLGADLVTLDEVVRAAGSLEQVAVETRINGAVHRRDVVANMTFSPAYLVSFLSHVMPLQPGDVLCTGTPGAVVITDGDVAGVQVDGVGGFENPVVRAEATTAGGAA